MKPHTYSHSNICNEWKITLYTTYHFSRKPPHTKNSPTHSHPRASSRYDTHPIFTQPMRSIRSTNPITPQDEPPRNTTLHYAYMLHAASKLAPPGPGQNEFSPEMTGSPNPGSCEAPGALGSVSPMTKAPVHTCSRHLTPAPCVWV